ncbi:MAG TPA: glutathione S-transferase family protein [Solirubrobacterales bacterium]|nr:glutathione S-transferase family protein [Solirubrobacterales bacterium]
MADGEHRAVRGAADGSSSGISGEFVRGATAFRDWVSADGSSGYRAEPNRYHLYVSYACPWASRAVIVRRLKGLEGAISMSVVDPLRDERGWRFGETQEKGPAPSEGLPGVGPDPIAGFQFLSEAYRATDPNFAGHVSVPVLWDTETGRAVNNESAEIIRMLGSEFDAFAERPELDLYPAELADEIDGINERVYAEVNNGVYRAGFASSQEAYEDAFDRLFEALDWLEDLLSERRYLAGDRITEADWRLFTTLVRFDPVYHNHFRCNLRKLVEYPHLYGYTRDLYQQPGIAETVVLDQIKRHYYMTHDRLNPSRIVPKGPDQDLSGEHRRDLVGAAA